MTVTEALREDHREIAGLLRALERQIDIFARAETPDYDIVVGVADYFLQYPDRCHHPKEDLIVAKLVESHPEAVDGVGDLIDEHRDLHQRVVRFREAVAGLLNGSDAPRAAIIDAARDFIAAQRRHMRDEEELLFPAADRVLTPDDWADIENRLSRRADLASGPWMEDMFRAVSAKLLRWQTEDGQASS